MCWSVFFLFVELGGPFVRFVGCDLTPSLGGRVDVTRRRGVWSRRRLPGLWAVGFEPRATEMISMSLPSVDSANSRCSQGIGG